MFNLKLKVEKINENKYILKPRGKRIKVSIYGVVDNLKV